MSQGLVEVQDGLDVTLTGWSVPAPDSARKLRRNPKASAQDQQAGVDAARSWDRPPRGMTFWEALVSSTTVTKRVSVLQEVLGWLKARTNSKTPTELRWFNIELV